MLMSGGGYGLNYTVLSLWVGEAVEHPGSGSNMVWDCGFEPDLYPWYVCGLNPHSNVVGEDICVSHHQIPINVC